MKVTLPDFLLKESNWNQRQKNFHDLFSSKVIQAIIGQNSDNWFPKEMIGFWDQVSWCASLYTDGSLKRDSEASARDFVNITMLHNEISPYSVTRHLPQLPHSYLNLSRSKVALYQRNEENDLHCKSNASSIRVRYRELQWHRPLAVVDSSIMTAWLWLQSSRSFLCSLCRKWKNSIRRSSGQFVVSPTVSQRNILRKLTSFRHWQSKCVL